MAKNEVHLEQLLGKRVRDKQGKVAGLLEEVRAEKHGDEWVVKEYLVGRAALFERLSAYPIAHMLTHIAGKKLANGYSVPWDQMDLSDPQKPTLRCSIAELKPLADAPEEKT